MWTMPKVKTCSQCRGAGRIWVSTIESAGTRACKACSGHGSRVTWERVEGMEPPPTSPEVRALYVASAVLGACLVFAVCVLLIVYILRG